MNPKKKSKLNYPPAPKGAKLSLNPIPPTLRDKTRYILFELQAPEPLTEKDVKHAITDELLRLFGEVGYADLNAQLMEWNPQKKQGILRCALALEQQCKAALLFVKEVSGNEIVTKTLKTSGTIAKLRRI